MQAMHPIALSPAEWELMEYLWDQGPAIGRTIASHFSGSKGWSRSTTLTLLRRLVEKGAAHCDEGAKPNVFSPAIGREETALQETDSFLQRIYKGSVSMMLSAMTKQERLSQEEIQELRAILDAAEQEGFQ